MNVGLVAEFEQGTLKLDAMADTRNRFDFIVTTLKGAPVESIGVALVEVRAGCIYLKRASRRTGRKFDRAFAADTVFKIVERAPDKRMIDVLRFQAGTRSVKDNGATEELCLGSVKVLKSLESRGAFGNP